jgi:acylphosphatase
MRRRIVVSGRVQGVGFRFATVRVAERLGLRGWVRNRRDGRVEIVAEGEPEDVRQLVDWCRTGPPGARVTDVSETEVVTAEPLEGFHVAY